MSVLRQEQAMNERPPTGPDGEPMRRCQVCGAWVVTDYNAYGICYWCEQDGGRWDEIGDEPAPWEGRA